MRARNILLGVGIGILFTAYLIQTNVFYQTGSDWFDTCWTAKNSKDTKPKTSAEAIKWTRCESIAAEAVYNAGFIMTGNPENAVNAPIKAVYAACPSSFSDLSIGFGEYGLAVDLIQRNGGPSISDKFLPAVVMIRRAYQRRWPRCSAERERAGYPRIVKQANGEWDFESDCEPCKLERQAAEQRSSGVDWEKYIQGLKKVE